MMECDFLVVGSGGGAFAAALAIKAEGLQPLIIEKRDKVGGTSGYSGGVVWIPANPLMEREGVSDTIEDGATYLDHLIGPACPGSSADKRAAFLRAAPEVIAFLEAQGMTFMRAEGWSDYQDELPGGHQRGRGLMAPLFNINELGEWKDRLSVYAGWEMPTSSHEFRDLMLIKQTWRGKFMAARLGWRLLMRKLTGSDYRGSGAALQGRQLKIALEKGISILTETPMVDLVTDETGRVVGVEAICHGEKVRITARRGVLLNCGGFAHNGAMRERWQPKPTPRWTNANPADTGDAIDAAMRLGVAMHNLDLSWYTPSSIQADGSLPPGISQPFMHHLDLAKPHVILVDADGRRFTNESSCYHDIGQAMYADAKWPMWAIIESRHRANYPWGTHPPGRPPKTWLDSGYMIAADTVEALAGICGIDPAGLNSTVERFNRFCSSGIDDDHQRGARAFDRYHGDPTNLPNPCLGAIERGPFYAVRMIPGDIGTDGGIVTDASGRAVRDDGSIVPGLYATGNSTASVMGRAYPGPGGTIGPSLVFGYIAARHAIEGVRGLSSNIQTCAGG